MKNEKLKMKLVRFWHKLIHFYCYSIYRMDNFAESNKHLFFEDYEKAFSDLTSFGASPDFNAVAGTTHSAATGSWSSSCGSYL